MDTVKLSEKEVSETLTDEDYIIVAKSDGSIRKIQATVIKEYIDSEILGGAS